MKYRVWVYNNDTIEVLYLTKIMYNLYYGKSRRFWKVTKVLRSDCTYTLHKNIYCEVI